MRKQFRPVRPAREVMQNSQGASRIQLEDRSIPRWAAGCGDAVEIPGDIEELQGQKNTATARLGAAEDSGSSLARGRN